MTNPPLQWYQLLKSTMWLKCKQAKGLFNKSSHGPFIPCFINAGCFKCMECESSQILVRFSLLCITSSDILQILIPWGRCYKFCDHAKRPLNDIIYETLFICNKNFDNTASLFGSMLNTNYIHQAQLAVYKVLMETLQSLAPDCLLLTKIDSDLEFSLVFFFSFQMGAKMK